MPQNFRSAVHLFFFDSEGRTLLSLRRNTGYMDDWYSVVAGHLEPGETVVQAGLREAREEVGATLKLEDIEVVGVMHRKDGEERIDFFARVHAWDGELTNMEPEKCVHIAWFEPEILPEKTVPYIRQAFYNFFQKRWFDTFGWDPRA
ncbi:MAG TPA: NUDIX domain-containing protein [Anaerolineales bacterium]|nr:NUDIX domain-containing protein [Anaerolineales bacterium]